MTKLTLIVELPDGTQQTLALSELQTLTALNGAVYTLVEQDTQRAPDELVLKRKGDYLYIEVEGKPVAHIDDFYSVDMNAIFSADGTSTPAEGMAVSSSDVLESSLVNDNGEATVVWFAQESGLSPLVWTGGILAGGIVGAVALSGGGGGTPEPRDSSADRVVVNDISTDNVVNHGEATENFNITGSGEAGATVNLTFSSERALADGNRAIVDDDGNWTVAVIDADITAMGEGAESMTVTQTDLAGNTSAPSIKTINIDTTTPTASSLLVTDDQGSVTGALVSGDSTDDTAPVLSGKTEEGSSVNVYDGDILLGAATVSGDTWTYEANIADGETYDFNVKETDAAGNESAATGNFKVTGDTIAPVISGISIPDAEIKVSDTIMVTLTVADDGGETYSNLSGTIGGFALSNLQRANSTTYTAEFTVTDGGTDVVAGADIPVSLTLNDIAGNTSATYV
ncbi:hypothetical protein CXF72_00055, partial [Psychromonas sp. MB-3u-54]|uniref:Ig-like domain-containing protein n=1 Tax=Psychromonas sp. MB-3u-54 TaxID=2058319 RepID=UPI000CAEBBA5